MAGNCKVYTPDNWVNILLDEVGYSSQLFGQRVLENSCGTGNILRRIVERYILDSLKNGYSKSQIKNGLEHDITGLEIESESLRVCKYTLDAEAEKYGIIGVKWDLRLCDALVFEEDDYSYVIGNPPYITYHDLSLQQRTTLRNEFETCKKGRFDYCYAFIEKSMGNLDEHGVLGYLLPNSILKNVWAEELRTFIQPYLRRIIDLKNQNVFDDVTLSPIILIAQKEKRHSTDPIHYQCEAEKIVLDIQAEQMGSSPWALGSYSASSVHTFGDFFQVANSVATLLNDAFIIKDYVMVDDNYVRVRQHLLERKILRPAISIKTLNASRQPLIIFPYDYNQEGELVHYEEDEMQNQFPRTLEHLAGYRASLDERTSDTSAKWYEYGRSQALRHLNKRKLIISTIVSGKVKIVEADENSIPYAGLYITAKGNLPLSRAKEILEQIDFLSYVKQHGVPTVNNSYRISKKIIEAYPITL